MDLSCVGSRRDRDLSEAIGHFVSPWNRPKCILSLAALQTTVHAVDALLLTDDMRLSWELYSPPPPSPPSPPL